MSVRTVDRGLPKHGASARFSRFAAAACFVAVAASAAAALAGHFLLPAAARVVHHSSGSTWSKQTSVVAFPAIVAGLVLGSLASRRLRQAGLAVCLAACAVFVATWQVVAFIAAG